MALNRKKLLRRAVTTAAGSAVLALFFLYLPKWCGALLLLAAGLAGVYEFRSIAHGFGLRLQKLPPVLTMMFGMATLYFDALRLEWLPYLAVGAAFLESLIPSKSSIKRILPEVGVSLVACGYLGFAIIFTAYIFHIDGMRGRILMIFFVLLVWAGDSAAYLVGSTIGKRKIAPVISPNKTVAGSIANFAGAAAAAWAAKAMVLPDLTWVDVIALTLMFGILGLMGDLVESSWKRGSRLKDSGRLFPGHGGVLDRIDSIFLTAPMFYFYVARVTGLAGG